MFMQAFRVVADRLNYEHTTAGWRGEFRGPVTVTAEAPSIEGCRNALIDALDAKVAEWLAKEPPVPSKRRRTQSA